MVYPLLLLLIYENSDKTGVLIHKITREEEAEWIITSCLILNFFCGMKH
jgi:hypothetical protein